MPTDFAEQLNTSDFKIEFLRFFFKDFGDPIYGPIIGEKGNDYSPSFNRKGKTKPITVMNKHEKYVNSFMALGGLPIANEIINIIEEFTCHLYGYTKQANIHEVIKIHFGNKPKPKHSQKPLGKHHGY